MGLLLWPTLISLAILVNAAGTTGVLKDCEGKDGAKAFSAILAQVIAFNAWEFFICFLMGWTMVIEFWYWPLVRCQFCLGVAISTYGLCCSEAYTVSPDLPGCLCFSGGFLYGAYKWLYEWSSKSVFDVILLLPGVQAAKTALIQLSTAIFCAGRKGQSAATNNSGGNFPKTRLGDRLAAGQGGGDGNGTPVASPLQIEHTRV